MLIIAQILNFHSISPGVLERSKGKSEAVASTPLYYYGDFLRKEGIIIYCKRNPNVICVILISVVGTGPTTLINDGGTLIELPLSEYTISVED